MDLLKFRNKENSASGPLVSAVKPTGVHTPQAHTDNVDAVITNAIAAQYDLVPEDLETLRDQYKVSMCNGSVLN